MAKVNNIKEELLRQMDTDLDGSTDVNKKSAKKIIENHKAQVRRLKWITVISWLITVLYLFGMHALKDFLLKTELQYLLTGDEFLLISYSDMGLKVLIVISVLVTYLSYCRSKTLTMLQIYARLASIEEHLKRMSQDK